MKSNRCLFNKTVFASDFKRFLPFAIPLLIANIIIFPVIIFDQYNLPNYPLAMDDFAAHSIACDIFSFIFAGVFALVVFSYMYNPRMNITMHSFPIGRKQLFATSYLAGYVMLILPQLIGFALSIPKIYTSSKIAGQIILFQIISILLTSFIFYTSAVLSVMLAGNIFAGAVIYGIINFVCYAVYAAFNTMTTYIGFGLSWFEDDFIFGKLPYSPLIDSILGKGNNLTTVSNAAVAQSNMKSFVSVAVYYTVVSLVLTILAYILYKARKLECAGDMVAFNIEIPVLSVIVSLVGGAAASLLLNEMLDFDGTMLLIVFAIFALISFFLTQMILRKKANVFKLKTVILGVVTCLIAVAVVFGAAKYRTNYIPSADKVEKVTVNASYDMEITDKTDINFVRDFQKALIENADNIYNGISPFNSYDLYSVVEDGPSVKDSMYRTYSIAIDYQLKDGKSIQRRYFISNKEQELLTTLSALEERYHPVSVFDSLEGIKFEIHNITVDKLSTNGADSLYIPSSDFSKLIEAVKTDSKQKLENYKTVLDREYYSEDPEYASYEISIACIVTDRDSLKKLAEDEPLRSDPSKLYYNGNVWYDDISNDYVANENFLLNYEIYAEDYDSELYKLLETYEAK